MPKSRSKSSGLQEQKKFCHCKPTCGEFITKRSRQRHYALIPEPSTIASSESDDENDSDCSASEMELDEFDATVGDAESPMGSGIRLFEEDLQEEVPMDVDNLCDDVGADNEDTSSNLASDSDHEYDGLDLDELSDDEWEKFDENEDQDVPFSREDMVRELEEMLDADEEAALWDV
ncbi:hypothetical protein C8R45DRAFT_1217521, partial [Mycena sanguinolenta]